MNSQKIHTQIVAALQSTKGVQQVQELYENPNRYGDTVGHISFRFDVEDKYNYRIGSCVVHYYDQNPYVFIPDKGITPLKESTSEEIITIVKSYYKLP